MLGMKAVDLAVVLVDVVRVRDGQDGRQIEQGGTRTL